MCARQNHNIEIAIVEEEEEEELSSPTRENQSKKFAKAMSPDSTCHPPERTKKGILK